MYSLSHHSAEFDVSKWLRKFGQLPPLSATEQETIDVWKERKDAKALLKAYLSEMPSKYLEALLVGMFYQITKGTFAFVYGPQDSGKYRMTNAVIREVGR